ncbi:hypothetical protein [Streptomyces wuyuanensis]|uniref:hypothetical protein n=1 Tax=Streptomyces wuyuanensis TaxID=1196353 RepID=UPI00367FF1A5
MLDHDWQSLEMISRSFAGEPEGLTRDDVLDNITLFWLTKSAVSAARLHWETAQAGISSFGAKGVKLPVAASVFPTEMYRPPKSWAEKAYPNLIHYNRVPGEGTSPPGSSPGTSSTRFARGCGRSAGDGVAPVRD